MTTKEWQELRQRQKNAVRAVLRDCGIETADEVRATVARLGRAKIALDPAGPLATLLVAGELGTGTPVR